MFKSYFSAKKRRTLKTVSAKPGRDQANRAGMGSSRMQKNDERRLYRRFEIPVVIDSTDLSPHPIVPEDVSAGGFKLVVSQKPKLHSEASCTLQIADDVFENCKGHVVWVKNVDSQPPSWEIGLTVKLTEGRANELELALEKLAGEMQDTIPPFGFV